LILHSEVLFSIVNLFLTGCPWSTECITQCVWWYTLSPLWFIRM